MELSWIVSSITSFVTKSNNKRGLTCVNEVLMLENAGILIQPKKVSEGVTIFDTDDSPKVRHLISQFVQTIHIFLLWGHSGHLRA